MPVVFDANAIHAFQEERINGVPAIAHRVMEAIFASTQIALDEGGLCLQEWVDCAGGDYPFAITDWVNNRMIEGLIVEASLCKDSCHKILSQAGLPKKDHKWVRLAVGASCALLISNDVDFFDPTAKNASAETKEKIKTNGSGPLAKLLRKLFGVRPVCLETATSHL